MTSPKWDPALQPPIREWLLSLTDYPSGKTALRKFMKYAKDDAELEANYGNRAYWKRLIETWKADEKPKVGTARNYASWALTALGLAWGKGYRYPRVA